MKSILILCLLFTINCNFIDISICLVKSDKLRAIIVDVLTSIKEKNWNKIILSAFLNFNEVKSIVQNCIEPKPKPIPDEPDSKDDLCEEKCKDEVEYHEREECYRDCFFGHY